MTEIEKGVPAPTHNKGRGIGKMLAEADIGDSIFLPGKKVTGASGSFSPYGRGWYLMRTVEGGVRVWKIAEPGGMGNPPKSNGADHD